MYLDRRQVQEWIFVISCRIQIVELMSNANEAYLSMPLYPGWLSVTEPKEFVLFAPYRHTLTRLRSIDLPGQECVTIFKNHQLKRYFFLSKLIVIADIQ